MTKNEFVLLRNSIVETAAKAAGNAPSNQLGDTPRWLDTTLAAVTETTLWHLPTLTGMELVFAQRRAKRLGQTLEAYLAQRELEKLAS